MSPRFHPWISRQFTQWQDHLDLRRTTSINKAVTGGFHKSQPPVKRYRMAVDSKNMQSDRTHTCGCRIVQYGPDRRLGVTATSRFWTGID